MHACLLTLLLAQSAPEPPRNLVIADLGLHVVGLGYQRSLTPQVALQVSFNLYVPWTQNLYVERSDVAGFVGRARVFVYPAAHAPTGFWMSPFFQAGIANETRNGQKQQGVVFAGGASAGWGWLIINHIHVALGAGVQYHASKFPGGRGFGRFYPTVDINLGFAF